MGTLEEQVVRTRGDSLKGHFSDVTKEANVAE